MNNSYYYFSLPKHIRLLFYKNMIKEKGISYTHEYIYSRQRQLSFYDFINGAFHWMKTKEGHSYWHNIACNEKLNSSTPFLYNNMIINTIVFKNNINHETKQILV